jgi:tetratricopeptide (TPR) repeat protein
MSDSGSARSDDGLVFDSNSAGNPRRCSFCRQDLGPGRTVHCFRCQAPYHEDCWLANHKRCAVYACEPTETPAPVIPQGTPVPRHRQSHTWAGILVACLIISGIIRLIAAVRPASQSPPLVPERTTPGVAEPFALDSSSGLKSKEADFYVHRAIARHSAGDYDNAFNDNCKAIELNPSLPIPYCNRGTLKVVRKDLRGALADFDAAIRLKPDYADAYRSRGYVKDQLGDLDGAIADCTRAVELNPRDGAAWRYRGASRQGREDLEGALGDYSRAIEVNPSDAAAWSSKGSVRRIQNDERAAIADFTRAIEADPKHAHAWHLRGHARSSIGDPKGAADDFSKALEFDPDTEKYFFDRGCARYDAGAWKESLADFDAVCAKLPSYRDDAQIRMFFARSRLGQSQEAADGLANYLRSRPSGEGNSWYLDCLRFLAGQISEDAFLLRIPSVAGRPQPERECEAYYYAGTMRLINADVRTARSHFRRSLSTEKRKLYEYDGAQAELKALGEHK